LYSKHACCTTPCRDRLQSCARSPCQALAAERDAEGPPRAHSVMPASSAADSAPASPPSAARSWSSVRKPRRSGSSARKARARRAKSSRASAARFSATHLSSACAGQHAGWLHVHAGLICISSHGYGATPNMRAPLQLFSTYQAYDACVQAGACRHARQGGSALARLSRLPSALRDSACAPCAASQAARCAAGRPARPAAAPR